ncbi:hypothetical protein JCM17844_02670 [Iodidimonas gelatinilytica]|uniref:Uncharacterized protein n=1 Tax=Iodidimonas gelatinilytica TaxID=1236966 RepID=A0A5A7ML10_9PROT|nr:hypothetical protein JCM17844_02670 [Iodidimonas gelatinilytica]
MAKLSQMVISSSIRTGTRLAALNWLISALKSGVSSTISRSLNVKPFAFMASQGRSDQLE